MHPAFSVIFLTTLIGVGQGLFLALYTSELYAAVRVLPAGIDTRIFYGEGSALALGFLMAGLIASMFHLGHPERGWRAVARWRTSWLSREVILLPAFMAVVFLYGLAHYTGWNPVLATLGAEGRVAVTLTLVMGGIGTLLAFGLFVATGMIYACLKFLREWATPLTVINFILMGGASGFMAATAWAAWQAPGLVQFYAVWSLILTTFAMLGRTAAWIRNARLKPVSTLQTAIGVRHTRIVQKSQGAMGGSFNTREFFHGKPEGFVCRMMWTGMIMSFLVPVLLLTVAIATNAHALFAAAFVTQYLGLIAERWTFFAQARHPQNLYYQTV